MKIGGAQDDVEEFHHAMGGGTHLFRGNVKIRDAELRAKLILEEALETVEALLGSSRAFDVVDEAAGAMHERAARRSLPDAVDGCIDTIYVCLGTLAAMGVDAEPIWRAVHAANMAKVGGGKDANGKFQKPPGWTPPDIEGELRRQGWKP